MYIGEDYGGLSLPTIAERLAARRELSLIVERALLALDALDIDPDMESDGADRDSGWPESGFGLDGGSPYEDDEPSLGWHSNGGGCWGREDGSDREADAGDDPDGYDSDREPSLGAGEMPVHVGYWSGTVSRVYGIRGGDQTHWAAGNRTERESDAGDQPEEESFL